MKEQWFFIKTETSPTIFGFTFGQKLEDSSIYGNVVENIISIENSFEIIFQARKAGVSEPLSGNLFRQVIAKTIRFPGLDVTCLDDQSRVLPSEQKNLAVYKKTIILHPHSQETSDYVFRFQTIWFLLAELTNHCTLTEFAGCTVTAQTKLFSKLLLALMEQEILYCAETGMKFSVNQLFLELEILEPMKKNRWLPQDIIIQFETAFRANIARYPQLASSGLCLAELPREPLSASAPSDVYGIAVSSMQMREQGIYGAREGLTADLYMTVLREKPPALAAMSMSSSSVPQPAAEPEYTEFPAGDSSSQQAQAAESVYDLPQSQSEPMRPSMIPADQSLRPRPSSPGVRSLPLTLPGGGDVYGDGVYHKKYTNLAIPMQLCQLLNDNQPIDFTTPLEFTYKLGGIRINTLLVHKTIFSDGSMILDHKVAKEGLQILITMCVKHSGRNYRKIFQQFGELHPDHYAMVGRIPLILAQCLKMRVSRDTLGEICQLLDRLQIPETTGIPKDFKTLLRDYPADNPVKVKFKNAMAGMPIIARQYLAEEGLIAVLDI